MQLYGKWKWFHSIVQREPIRKQVHKEKHNDEVVPVNRPIHVCDNLFFFLAQQPPSGPGPPHSRGL